MSSTDDRPAEFYMQRCLQLAMNGIGHTAPNPLVGCVIVHNDKIIGEGYHRQFGKAHAEVNAIDAVDNKTLLQESTLYVNLEPCAHHGKTPPCADLIIEKRIPQVVIGTKDPHSVVAGKGIEKMQKAGIEVKVNVLRQECQFINRRFFTYHHFQRPYIILKWAQTKDGFIDKIRKPEESGVNWITGETSKRLVHQWRAKESAILVGKTTVVNDNPTLTVREVVGKNPLRVVIDRDCSIPSSSNVFNHEANTIVFNSKKNERVNQHLEYFKIEFDGTQLGTILHELYERKIQSILIEGGAYTLNAFIEQNLWDEARLFVGDVSFENGLLAPILKANWNATKRTDSDIFQIAFNNNNEFIRNGTFI